MTSPSLPFVLGLSVLPVPKPKGLEDEDGHCLPLEKRTVADADGRADTRSASHPVMSRRHDQYPMARDRD
jgi:hypothetical protein